MRVRKKPVEVEAIIFYEKVWELTPTLYPMIKLAPTSFYIDTLEGRMRVKEGDYIIKGVHGEYYPCKPDIFEKTYEILN